MWVTSPGKESRPAEILAESGGNTEWVLTQESYKYQMKPYGQL